MSKPNIPAKPSPAVIEYNLAWLQFKKTERYDRCVKAMSGFTKQPYIDNILEESFNYAFWYGKG